MVDGVGSINEAASRTGAGRTGLVSNFETFLTLLTTPVVYMYMDRLRRPRADEAKLARLGDPAADPA